MAAFIEINTQLCYVHLVNYMKDTVNHKFST